MPARARLLGTDAGRARRARFDHVARPASMIGNQHMATSLAICIVMHVRPLVCIRSCGCIVTRTCRHLANRDRRKAILTVNPRTEFFAMCPYTPPAAPRRQTAGRRTSADAIPLAGPPGGGAAIHNLRGAMLMSLCMLAFVLNDGIMKTLFTQMTIYQAIFLRGLITAPIIALMAWRQGVLVVGLPARERWLVLLRVVAEVAATVCFLTALSVMPLANAMAILQALPLSVTLAAALFLGEAVGWRRWSAIAVGFAGILVIVRPGMEGFSIHSLWVLGAVVAVTIREIATRQLASYVPSLFVAMTTAVATCGLGAVAIPAIAWVEVGMKGWLLLGTTSVAISIAYLLSVVAVRTGELGFVSPFRYTAMIWAIGLGVILFTEFPDGATLAGTGIVIAAGIYTLARERHRREESLKKPVRPKEGRHRKARVG